MLKKDDMQLCINELQQALACEPDVIVSKDGLIRDGKLFCQEHEIRLMNKVYKIPNFHIRVELH